MRSHGTAGKDMVVTMRKNEEKRVSVIKIIAISAGVALLIVTVAALLYKFFKKYFRISFDCGDCDTCCQDCFGDEFDPLCSCDEDFAPGCSICDESDAADSAEAQDGGDAAEADEA